MVMVTTSGGSSGILPFSALPRPNPFSRVRAAPILTAGVILLLMLGLRANYGWNARPRRLALGGVYAATAFFLILGVIFAATGCGGGSTTAAAPQLPQVVTQQGTSMITITPSATSASGKPLQLQPIQLTLTVN